MENKVTVRIYGQEYTISGEESREHIMQVADYVDGKMLEISSLLPGATTQTVAMLAAVNISDEYFTAKKEKEELEKSNEQLKKDTEHYVGLWDEAKSNFMAYKEETSEVNRQKEEMMRSLSEAEAELEKLREELREAKEKASLSVNQQVVELEKKCKELETSFFDVQMENITLKSEVEHYKSIL